MLEKFLQEVCLHVRCKAAHKEICEELTGHVEELQSTGMTLDAAIASMGNCEEIGLQLDKQHRPQIAWSLIGLVAFISVVGIIMLSMSEPPYEGMFTKALIWLAIGVACTTGTLFFNYTKLKAWALPLYIGAIVFILLGMVFGVEANGVQYLRFWAGNAVSLHITTVPFVLAFAGFLDQFRGEGFRGIVKLLVLGAVSILMMLLVPNMIYALIMVASYAVLLFVAVARTHFGGNTKTQKALLYAMIGLTAAAAILLLICEPYRMSRLLGFFTHTGPAGADWHSVQISKVLAHANWFGSVGAIEGLAVNDMIPTLPTDFALVNVIATFGWAAGIALLLAIVALIIRLFMLTRNVKSSFGYYLALVSCVVLTIQFVISVLMNLGLFPLVMVGLPFVSYGGTAMVANCVLIGIILAVWRRNTLIGAMRKVQHTQKAYTKLFEYADGKFIINFKG